MPLRNRRLIGWKIFYGDGRRITSKTQKWIDSPQENIQIVKLFYQSDNGIEINVHKGQEYYILDSLLELPKEIKIGKGIEGFQYVNIEQNAINDEEIIDSMI